MIEGIAFKDIMLDKSLNGTMASTSMHSQYRVPKVQNKMNIQKHQFGCPKTLGSLICQGVYDPLSIGT